ncbi:hypothetical protein [Acidisoma silvae]|uniref:Uncharacterized protein n=1 Tax=Acidisoma silvae TaxID=2802396 RepID=A0A963YVW4_9PROT|nr:hypothetical protein [Acidisoma silvae]MCB8878089.1 hypothetical protein [Acidisoma silvae]
MSQTVYDARSADAWRLVHDEGIAAKRAASKLNVNLAELYEMLAAKKLRVEMATHRRAALGSYLAIQRTPHNAQQA